MLVDAELHNTGFQVAWGSPLRSEIVGNPVYNEERENRRGTS